MIIEKDVLFLLTSGEYSDYTAITLCKADVAIDIMILRGEYLASYPEQNTEYKFNQSQFVKWLIVDKQVCKEIDYQEWHIGSYGIAEFTLNNGDDK